MSEGKALNRNRASIPRNRRFGLTYVDDPFLEVEHLASPSDLVHSASVDLMAFDPPMGQALPTRAERDLMDTEAHPPCGTESSAGKRPEIPNVPPGKSGSSSQLDLTSGLAYPNSTADSQPRPSSPTPSSLLGRDLAQLNCTDSGDPVGTDDSKVLFLESIFRQSGVDVKKFRSVDEAIANLRELQRKRPRDGPPSAPATPAKVGRASAGSSAGSSSRATVSPGQIGATVDKPLELPKAITTEVGASVEKKADVTMKDKVIDTTAQPVAATDKTVASDEPTLSEAEGYKSE